VDRLQRDVNVDGTKIILLFGCIILIAVTIGGIIAVWVIPMVGEFIGNFFFNPNQQIEKSPHSDALAKIAQGDYEGAIEEYRKNLEQDPEDMHAFSEIIHIYCDKLHDHDAAEHFLEEALKNEWPPEQGAFIASRLVDVYWNHRRDASRARHVLMQIAESMPDTRHSANAIHRLHEIDRALADEAAGIVHLPSKSERPPGVAREESTPGEAEAKDAPGEVEAEG
jgi:tetratricopeptide (TPR) repeat protein